MISFSFGLAIEQVIHKQRPGLCGGKKGEMNFRNGTNDHIETYGDHGLHV
jgi:hypothetical protein